MGGRFRRISGAVYTLSLNMELGVVIEGGSLPEEVAAHFEALMGAGVLRVHGGP